MKRTASALLTIATIAALTGCTVPASDDGETAADRADTSGAASKKAKPKTGAKKDKKADAPKESAGQANARESAASYLDLTGFSRQGLIDQLTQFEGFSKEDAAYGVDAQKADYKKQAALSAKSYLDVSSFSHSGLVDQLVQFDKYTKEQAEAGVKAVGL